MQGQAVIVISGELYSSKNSRQILRRDNGKPFIAKSVSAKRQEKDMLWQFKDNVIRAAWKRMISGKVLPLRLHFLIYRRTNQRFDYINIVQNLLDILVSAHYLEDDNANIVIPVFEPYCIDRSHPRVELWVE